MLIILKLFLQRVTSIYKMYVHYNLYSQLYLDLYVHLIGRFAGNAHAGAVHDLPLPGFVIVEPHTKTD